MALGNSAYNLATPSKWILSIPFKKIDNTLGVDDISLNLTEFTMPEISIGLTPFGVRGQGIQIPGGVRNNDTLAVFNYLIDEKWKNYLLLYKWLKMTSNENGGRDKTYEDTVLDCSVLHSQPIQTTCIMG